MKDKLLGVLIVFCIPLFAVAIPTWATMMFWMPYLFWWLAKYQFGWSNNAQVAFALFGMFLGFGISHSIYVLVPEKKDKATENESKKPKGRPVPSWGEWDDPHTEPL